MSALLFDAEMQGKMLNKYSHYLLKILISRIYNKGQQDRLKEYYQKGSEFYG